MATRSKSINGEAIIKLRTGLALILGKSDKLEIQGKEVKGSEILDSLDALIADDEATAAARAVYRAAVTAQDARRAELAPLVSGVRTHLRATRSDEQLAACGIVRKGTRRAPSVDERMARATKARATREAKHARGVRQERIAKARATIAAAFAPDPPAAEATPPEAGPTEPTVGAVTR